MQKLLIAIVFLAVGCSSPMLCNGPAIRTGTGWCPNVPAPGLCEVNALCPGYCLPDGGSAIDDNSMPYRCGDGGTH